MVAIKVPHSAVSFETGGLLEMMNLLNTLRMWISTHAETDEKGATGAEYAVLVFFVAVVMIIGATALGISINDTLDDVSGAI